MAEILDLNRNAPMKPLDATVEGEEKESTQAHRRVEREADKAAERGKERKRQNDQGEFSNVGPV